MIHAVIRKRWETDAQALIVKHEGQNTGAKDTKGIMMCLGTITNILEPPPSPSFQKHERHMRFATITNILKPPSSPYQKHEGHMRLATITNILGPPPSTSFQNTSVTCTICQSQKSGTGARPVFSKTRSVHTPYANRKSSGVATRARLFKNTKSTSAFCQP